MHKPMMNDLDWLRDAVQAEEEYGGDIQIGGRPPVKQQIDPTKLQQGRNQIRLYSLLFGELKRLIDEVDFGCGTKAAWVRGRQLIFERIQALSSNQQARFDALLADASMLSPTQLQVQLRQQLYLLLDESDWQQITATTLSVLESKLRVQLSAG